MNIFFLILAFSKSYLTDMALIEHLDYVEKIKNSRKRANIIIERHLKKINNTAYYDA